MRSQKAGRHGRSCPAGMSDPASRCRRRSPTLRADASAPSTLLVNNAGHVPPGARSSTSRSPEFDRMFAVHVRGTFLMCQRGAAGDAGTRARASSSTSPRSSARSAASSSSTMPAPRAAIIGMTKSLAREVAAQGVRVNAVAPGPDQHAAGRWRCPRTGAGQGRRTPARPLRRAGGGGRSRRLSRLARRRACSSARRSGRIPAT